MKNSAKEQDPEKKRAGNRLLGQILWEQKCLVILVLPLSFISTIGVYFSPNYIGGTIDELNKGNIDEFNKLMVEWVLIIAVGAIFSGISETMFGTVAEGIGMSVRQRFFESIMRKDTGFFDARKVGDILSRLTSDTQVVQNGLTTNIAMFLKAVIFIIVAIVVQFIYSWKITLISIAFMFIPMCTMTVWQRLT